MSEAGRLTPLRPREFFARTWQGEGEFVPARWLRWLPLRRRFHFRSSCEWRSDTEWVVHDETTYENGVVERRTMRARLVAPDRIETRADDMPGGTTLTLEERGFRFEPYRLLVPVGPAKVRLRCSDRCVLEPGDTLVDTIDMRMAFVPIGRVTMRLRPGPPGPPSDAAQPGHGVSRALG